MMVGEGKALGREIKGQLVKFRQVEFEVSKVFQDILHLVVGKRVWRLSGHGWLKQWEQMSLRRAHGRGEGERGMRRDWEDPGKARSERLGESARSLWGTRPESVSYRP